MCVSFRRGFYSVEVRDGNYFIALGFLQLNVGALNLYWYTSLKIGILRYRALTLSNYVSILSFEE